MKQASILIALAILCLSVFPMTRTDAADAAFREQLLTPVLSEFRPGWQETLLSWDDSVPDTMITGHPGWKVAVGFQSPEWANYVIALEFYVMDDGVENPVNPEEPSTQPVTLWVWRPGTGGFPGFTANDGFVPFGSYGCPEDTLIRFDFPNPIDITNETNFPERRFFAGLEWEYRFNPYIGVDTTGVDAGNSYHWNWTQWEPWDGDIIIHAIVGADTTTYPPPPPPIAIHVDVNGGGDYLTIQEGIDGARPGFRDSVVVAPGVYTGPMNRGLTTDGKHVYILSKAGPESTIIDCGFEDRGFFLIDGDRVMLEGLTIRNGLGTGGAIRTVKSSVCAFDCVFESNMSGEYGGAIYANHAGGGGAWFRRCIFTDNEAADFGGAVHLDFSRAWFDSCTFVGNEAPVGSAISCATTSAPWIEHCIIAHNREDEAVHCTESSDPELVRNCVFANAGGDSLCGTYSENMFVSPLLCPGEFTLCEDSPCLPENNPWGAQIGARGVGDCGPSTGVNESQSAAQALLSGPFPNPFDHSARFDLDMPTRGTVTLTIYDIAGRLVWRVLDKADMREGHSEIWWDGKDGEGRTVASGIYFCRLEIEDSVASRRVVFLR